MDRQFTTRHDIVMAFAYAMNLISPEVENHHEKVAYLAYRLAETLGMNEQQRTIAFFGGLLHDIGGVLMQENISLADLALSAGQVASAGAALLRSFPVTLPFAPAVRECQTPWQRLKKLRTTLKTPQRIGQVVHLADAVTLLMCESEPALNQIAQVKEMILSGGREEFSPEVLAAFETLCGQEAVWLDLMYRPQAFLELLPDNHLVTLDETVHLTEFMSKIIDFRSPFTAMHSAGVAATAAALAKLSGMSEEECKMMRIAGYLHDIGKLKIPNEVLEKPGKLTEAEFNVIKEHAYYTWLLLKDVNGFGQIADWASLHHEKLNGNGYPFHLKGEQLPLGARIMTVADIFSALTEDRPYRKSMEKEQVIAILREDAQRELLSQRLVELLIGHYDPINAQRDTESKAASRKYQESLAAI